MESLGYLLMHVPLEWKLVVKFQVIVFFCGLLWCTSSTLYYQPPVAEPKDGTKKQKCEKIRNEDHHST
jgi:hypothetical protein